MQRWLEEDFPAIHRQAHKEGAEIFWGDEMGVRSDHASHRTFGQRGITPLITNSVDGSRGYMITALNNSGTGYYMCFERRFSAGIFLESLKSMVRQADRKVFLIVDEHPIHRDIKVKKWLAGQKGQSSLRLFFRPRALCLV